MAAERLTKVFEFSSLDNNRINGLCKYCKKNYKDKNGIYSNFIKHLKRIHPLEHDQIFPGEAIPVTDGVSGNIDNRCSTDMKNVKEKQNQFVISITKNLIQYQLNVLNVLLFLHLKIIFLINFNKH